MALPPAMSAITGLRPTGTQGMLAAITPPAHQQPTGSSRPGHMAPLEIWWWKGPSSVFLGYRSPLPCLACFRLEAHRKSRNVLLTSVGLISGFGSAARRFLQLHEFRHLAIRRRGRVHVAIRGTTSSQGGASSTEVNNCRSHEAYVGSLQSTPLEELWLYLTWTRLSLDSTRPDSS
jgi:hypothetical protein